MTASHQIATEFAVLDDNLDVDVVPVTEDFYAKLTERYGDFSGKTLISSHSFDADWPTWEVHPKGDEIVVLVTGEATMVLATNTGETNIVLQQPGEYVVVPRGVWHTAKVSTATSMLFITPGEGTENRDQPVR